MGQVTKLLVIKIGGICRAWIHGQNYVTPIVYLHSFMEGNQSGWLPPANVVCEGYVFTPVCDSVNRGGMCGCSGRGGVHGCSQGGMHGCPGGRVWLLPGGMCGCSGGHA